MNALTWIGVGLLGGAGALLRVAVTRLVDARAGGCFPVGTLAVNLSGALALGLLSGFEVGGDALLLAGTALLGSCTTFSTWMLDSRRLGEEGRRAAAGANLALGVVLGLAAVAAGRVLGGVL